MPESIPLDGANNKEAEGANGDAQLDGPRVNVSLDPRRQFQVND